MRRHGKGVPHVARPLCPTECVLCRRPLLAHEADGHLQFKPPGYGCSKLLGLVEATFSPSRSVYRYGHEQLPAT